MANMDWDQLEAMKRQLEDDCRMDIAAIERLQRRFSAANGRAAGAVPSSTTPVLNNVSVMENLASAPPRAEPSRVDQSRADQSRVDQSRVDPSRVDPSNQAESEDLTMSLRTMFSNYRK
jgi:hypothetical protein